MITSDTPKITVDSGGCRVIVGEAGADLTAAENRVMRSLADKPGVFVTRTELHFALYSARTTAPPSNVVEVLIGRIRRKLESLGAPDVIRTKRGLGYGIMAEVRHVRA